MAEMYDNIKHVKDTFNEKDMPEYLLQAQWAEFIELKKIITELYNKKKSPLTILDIGIGDARILKHIFGIKEIWSVVESYDGIDISKNCIDISNNVIKELKIGDKVKTYLLDASNLNHLNKKYDLIICTWFTAGNFYPINFNFHNFNHTYDLSKNDKFSNIFKKAYEMLNKYGEIVIGSMYLDNDSTRKKQECTYKHWGWEIITDERDCFTASKEGWWSQRFTKDRIYDYLSFISKSNIFFIPLDTYDFAIMVRIKK